LLQAWNGHLDRASVLIPLSAAFAAPGHLRPELLRPVERVFRKVGRVIGHFNGRVLLSLLYLLVVTPIAFLRRAAGARPLEDDRPALGAGTWRPIRHDPDDTARYERLFS
jgi:hypothetical protein